MHMENWKFLINRLLAFLGMLGTFIGATFTYNSFLISNLGNGIFFAIVGLEMLVLSLFGFDSFLHPLISLWELFLSDELCWCQRSESSFECNSHTSI